MEEENGQTGLSWKKAKYWFFFMTNMQKSVYEHTNLKAEGLQLQKTTPGVIPVS